MTQDETLTAWAAEDAARMRRALDKAMGVHAEPEQSAMGEIDGAPLALNSGPFLRGDD